MFLKSLLTARPQVCAALARTTPLANIVYGYTPKRSPFDKTNYREDYEPRPNKYHPLRKPRIPEWDDPNVIWPRLQPRSTRNTGRELITEIDLEERQKIDVQRNFIFPDFRPGDVVQFNFLHSVSSDRGNVFTGIIIGKRRPNRTAASFNVIFRAAGVEVLMLVKQCSPLLKDFKIVEKGSGNLRSQLNYLWKKHSLRGDQTRRPILNKGRATRKEEMQEKKRQLSRISKIKTKTSLREKTLKDPIFGEDEDIIGVVQKPQNTQQRAKKK